MRNQRILVFMIVDEGGETVGNGRLIVQEGSLTTLGAAWREGDGLPSCPVTRQSSVRLVQILMPVLGNVTWQIFQLHVAAHDVIDQPSSQEADQRPPG